MERAPYVGLVYSKLETRARLKLPLRGCGRAAHTKCGTPDEQAQQVSQGHEQIRQLAHGGLIRDEMADSNSDRLTRDHHSHADADLEQLRIALAGHKQRGP